MFDFSGTLFRLEHDNSWFDAMQISPELQAVVMRRLTSAAGDFVEMTPDEYHAWINRDLHPDLHRTSYLRVLEGSGMTGADAEALYRRVVDFRSWTPYPDAREVLQGLSARGIRTAVVSNIPFDVRPAFAAADAVPDEYVLSFEVGVMKPDAKIFNIALQRMGVSATEAVMVGDSDEVDGAARELGCGFVHVEPLPTRERRDGLLAGLRAYGISL